MADVVADTTVWDRLRQRVGKLDRRFVRVGVLASKGGGATHDDKATGIKLTLVDIMRIHEFGATVRRGNVTFLIPERAPIRRTFYVYAKEELVAMQIKLAKAVVLSGMEPMRALGLLGSWAANRIKKSMTAGEGLPPPLALSTIAHRKHGGERPLVDTGLLKNSISYEVSEGTPEDVSASEASSL